MTMKTYKRISIILHTQETHDNPQTLETVRMNPTTRPNSHTSSSNDPADSVRLNPTTIPIPLPLPDTVRGAPESLKPAIRKKQNKASAARSRMRRREVSTALARSADTLSMRYAGLEQRVVQVEEFLAALGYEKPVVTRSAFDTPDGSSVAQDGMGESDSRDVPPAGQVRMAAGEGAEDEVQLLIERCMGQL